MKLLILIALFALAAARVDISGFEPIHVGPALVDFEPEPHIGSIDKETVLAILRRLLERLVNVQSSPIGAEPIHVGPAIVDGFEPIHVGPAIVDGFEPIHIGPAIVGGFEPEPGLEEFREWIFQVINPIWPKGIPRLSRPPAGSLEAIREWLLAALEIICSGNIPGLPPPHGSINAIKAWILDLIKNLWPNGPPKPDSIHDVLEWLRRAISHVFPNGITLPSITQDDRESIRVWLRQLLDRLITSGIPQAIRDRILAAIEEHWPENIPRPPWPPVDSLESLKDLIRYILEHIKESDNSALEIIIDLVRRLLDRLRPEGISYPPRPHLNSIADLKDWIHEIITLLEGQPIQSPDAIPTPSSSPLVQIIVNVKKSESDLA